MASFLLNDHYCLKESFTFGFTYQFFLSYFVTSLENYLHHVF